MIFTEKIVSNRFIQELLDSGSYTAEQLNEIHDVCIKVFGVGYDVGRLENPRWKQVLQLDKFGNVVEEYPSVKNAADKTGIARESIKRVVHGERHKAGGYMWRFKNLTDYGL
jgi:hypothetical protein